MLFLYNRWAAGVTHVPRPVTEIGVTGDTGKERGAADIAISPGTTSPPRAEVETGAEREV